MSVAQLSFVGVGFSAGHITLEGFATLKAATRIYYYHESSGPPWLKKVFPGAVDIFSVTEGNSSDRRYRYEDTVELLLSKAREGHTVAAFYGSPAFMACISHTALQRGRERGISVAILPGISTFEALLCDLAGHPVAGKAVNCRGVCVVTAREYLQNPARFSTFVPLILLMVGHVGTNGDGEDRAGLNHLAVILAQQYQNPFFECVLYHCSADGPPVIRTTPICRLPAVPMPPEGWSAVTLLIPAAEPHPATQTRAIQRAFAAGVNYAKIEQLIQQRQARDADS
jgi:precorrin-2 methylase